MAKEQNSKIVTRKHLARLEKEQIQRKWVISVSLAVLVLIVGVILYGILDQTVLKGTKTVASVGKDKIKASEFIADTRFYRWQLIQQFESVLGLAQTFGSDPNFGGYFQEQLQQIQTLLTDPTQAGEATLNQLIEDRIIRQEAAKLGIVVTKAEVDLALESAFGFYPDGEPTPTEFPTPLPTGTVSAEIEKLIATIEPTIDAAQTLAPTEEPTAAPTAITEPTASEPLPTEIPQPTPTEYTRDGYTARLGEFMKKWADIKVTEADVFKIYENGLYRQKISEAITADLQPVEEQVWARHILVEDIKSAQDVLTRLKNGENWSVIAAEVSKDTSNKDAGGDLGWFSKGNMVAPFEEAAFALAVGETSEPIKTDFGFHIIQVLGHENRSIDYTTFKQLKDQAFSKWLDEQKGVITIQKFDIWKTLSPAEPVLETQVQ